RSERDAELRPCDHPPRNRRVVELLGAEQSQQQTDEQAEPRAGTSSGTQHPPPRQLTDHPFDQHQVDTDDRHIPHDEVVVRQMVDSTLRLLVRGVGADRPTGRWCRQALLDVARTTTERRERTGHTHHPPCCPDDTSTGPDYGLPDEGGKPRRNNSTVPTRKMASKHHSLVRKGRYRK